MQTIYGRISDTYTNLTGTGLQPGMVYEVPNSPNKKIFVQNCTVGTIAAGAACEWYTPASYLVTQSQSAGTPVICVNDNAGTANTGASIAVNVYFWASLKGFCYPLCATGTLERALLNPSAAAGVLGAYATTGQSNIMACAANAGAATQTCCFIS